MRLPARSPEFVRSTVVEEEDEEVVDLPSREGTSLSTISRLYSSTIELTLDSDRKACTRGLEVERGSSGYGKLDEGAMVEDRGKERW